MKNRDLINLVYKNIKFERNKILSIAGTTTLLLLLSSVFVFSHTILNYIYSVYYLRYDTRTLVTDITLSEEEIDKLLKNEHIVSVHNQTVTTINISNENYSDIVLYPLDDNALPDIVKGTSDTSNGGIICPSDFSPNVGTEDILYLTYKDIINGNDLIGEKINAKFDVYTVTDDFKYEVTDTIDKTFTIVGTYDSTKYMFDNNVCIVSYDDFHEITHLLESQYITYYENTRILVDNFDNVETVQNILNEMGYTSNPVTFLDYQTIRVFLLIIILVLIIFLLVIYIIIKFNIKRTLSKKEQEILLYKSIGYTKKDILKIYYLEHIIDFLIATLLSIVLTIILIAIIKNILNDYFILNLITIKYGIIEIICMIVFGFLYPSIVIVSKINKVINRKKVIL